NPAELPKSLLDHREHFVSIGNISLDGDGLSPGSANILHYCVGSFTAFRKVHNHRRAFPSQELRSCSPNAARRTSHEGHLPIKSSAHTDTPPSLATSIDPGLFGLFTKRSRLCIYFPPQTTSRALEYLDFCQCSVLVRIGLDS